MPPRLIPGILALLAVLASPAAARADITAFLGVNPQPSTRMTTGFAAGFGLLLIGFEFEYARAHEDDLAGAPALTTGMANLLVQTPFAVSGIQVYGTVGVGGYREQLIEHQETHIGTNLGAGVKITLAGPLRLRLDYRLFMLQGSPLHERPQRFYAGLNIGF